MEPTVKIEMSVNEVNTILRVLSKHPFEEVFSLIQKIKSQGEQQLAQITAPAPQKEA